MTDERHVREQYDRWIGGWTPTALYVRWYLRHGGARYAAALFAALGDRPLPRVLDVGCATGFYLQWAWAHGHGRQLLAGVDINERLLGEAAARLARLRDEGAAVVLRQSSAIELPFDDGSFDAVICNGVLKYLDDEMLGRFLGEAARVLAPAGRLAIADFGRPVAWQARVMPPELLGIPVADCRTGPELVAHLEACGYSAVAEIPLRRLRRLPMTYEGAVGTKPCPRRGR